MSTATTGTASHTFRSGDYLRSLMAELDHAQISLRLKQARTRTAVVDSAGHKRKLSQDRMADLMHVHRRTVEDWENPKHPNVPFERLDEWAQITGVTKGWLLLGDEAPESQTLAGEVRELRLMVERLLRAQGIEPDEPPLQAEGS